jgi:hypothetical protein
MSNLKFTAFPLDIYFPLVSLRWIQNSLELKIPFFLILGTGYFDTSINVTKFYENQLPY